MLLACAILVVGCNLGPPAPQPPSPPPGEANQAELAALEVAGLDALAADQLTEPEAGSAYALFSRMLWLDPGNEAGRRGLEQVAERYLALAEHAAGEERYHGARSLVAKARRVDPAHPGIEAIVQQIRLLETAERFAIKLDRHRLAARDPRLASDLASFGTSTRPRRCLSTIFSSQDADARWIYAQLASSPGDGRIRADFELGSPPRVETLCFAGD